MVDAGDWVFGVVHQTAPLLEGSMLTARRGRREAEERRRRDDWYDDD